MKKTTMIIAFIVATMSLQAGNGATGSTVVFNTFDNQPFTVQLDGQDYRGNSRVMIEGLSSGRHKVVVQRKRPSLRNDYRSNTGGFVQTLYRGTIDVPFDSKVKAVVTRSRQLHIQSVKPLYAHGPQIHPNNGHTFGPNWNNGGHRHYTSQACTQECPEFVYECTSAHVPDTHYGSQNCDNGCPAHNAHEGNGQHDHYGSQSCDNGCPAFNNNTGQSGQQYHDHYGSETCDTGCPAFGQGNGQHGGNGTWGGWDDGQGHNDHEGNIGMGVDRFARLLKNVKRADFESTRFEIAKQSIDHESLSTSQTIELMQLFSFESSRLEIAKMAYDRVVDPDNFLDVTSEFTFMTSTHELIDYMNA